MSVVEINPLYNRADPNLSFAQIESGCELREITSQNRNFHLDILIEKLAKLADNIVDVTSTHMTSIADIRNSELDPLDKI